MSNTNKSLSNDEERKFEISQLETSLIQFLSLKKDIETIPGGHRRIQSLKLRIYSSAKEPAFAVQLGMCEASFDAISGLKTRGSCFGLVKYVRDWFLRSSVMEVVRRLAVIEE